MGVGAAGFPTVCAGLPRRGPAGRLACRGGVASARQTPRPCRRSGRRGGRETLQNKKKKEERVTPYSHATPATPPAVGSARGGIGWGGAAAGCVRERRRVVPGRRGGDGRPSPAVPGGTRCCQRWGMRGKADRVAACCRRGCGGDHRRRAHRRRARRDCRSGLHLHLHLAPCRGRGHSHWATYRIPWAPRRRQGHYVKGSSAVVVTGSVGRRKGRTDVRVPQDGRRATESGAQEGCRHNMGINEALRGGRRGKLSFTPRRSLSHPQRLRKIDTVHAVTEVQVGSRWRKR